MKISKRIKTICEFVPTNSKVIDIGADHALTDIYLEKTKNCNCLATDISENAIEKAKENIKKANAKVKTKVTNGLKGIKINDEIIIISGMGAHTIINILDKNIKNDIIISSNNNVPLIRKFMISKGYHIEKEVAIKDKYYYVITYYKYGKNKKINYLLSPFLLNNKEYMTHLLKFYEMKYTKETNIKKKINYYILKSKIQKIIKKKV